MISTPGAYATAEALKALKRGLSVFLFSDNVPIEDEIELKRLAVGKRLLMMGPDCGTAIVGLTAQALLMGDECHNRNVAATSLFARLLAPALVRTSPSDTAAAVLDFLGANDHFYLNLSMAACKSALDAAHGIAGATVVTAMARNGVEFGIRVSGAGDRWFTAPALVPDGLYFPGHGPAEANPDLGDSAITETMGLGGFAMAAAPAIVRFVGGSHEDALAYTREMATITLARNAGYGIPALGFAGTPTGIDCRRVVDSGVVPVINTGIAHREAGVGQIGAGIARAPLPCFAAALAELGRRLGLTGARRLERRSSRCGAPRSRARTAVSDTLRPRAAGAGFSFLRGGESRRRRGCAGAPPCRADCGSSPCGGPAGSGPCRRARRRARDDRRDRPGPWRRG